MKRLFFNVIKYTIILIAFFSIGSFFTSCSKYVEGSKLTLLSKKNRIVGSWKLTSGTVNGQVADLTGIYQTYTFNKDGSCNASYQVTLPNNSFSDNQLGKWNFSEDKLKLEILFNGANEKYITSIIKLSKNELKIKEVTNGETKVFTYTLYGEDGCNCGEVINDDIEVSQGGNLYYTLTIKNTCTENTKKFYVSELDWTNTPVGSEFCVTNEEIWMPTTRTINKKFTGLK